MNAGIQGGGGLFVVFLYLVVVVCFEVWFDLAVPDAHS